MFVLFPHEDIPRGELLTLVRREATSDERKDPETNSPEDNMGIPRIAQILDEGELQHLTNRSAELTTYEGRDG